jgi:Na+-transporting NADH:ubiquinone oxidoreductase subunit NqrD
MFVHLTVQMLKAYFASKGYTIIKGLTIHATSIANNCVTVAYDKRTGNHVQNVTGYFHFTMNNDNGNGSVIDVNGRTYQVRGWKIIL